MKLYNFFRKLLIWYLNVGLNTGCFLIWDFYSQLFHSIIVIILNVLWFVFYFCFMFIYHRCVFNSWVLIYLIRNIWIWICCFLKVRNCLCHVNLIILQSLRTQRIVSIMQHRMLRRRMQRFLSIFQSFIFFYNFKLLILSYFQSLNITVVIFQKIFLFSIYDI